MKSCRMFLWFILFTIGTSFPVTINTLQAEDQILLARKSKKKKKKKKRRRRNYGGGGYSYGGHSFLKKSSVKGTFGVLINKAYSPIFLGVDYHSVIGRNMLSTASLGFWRESDAYLSVTFITLGIGGEYHVPLPNKMAVGFGAKPELHTVILSGGTTLLGGAGESYTFFIFGLAPLATFNIGITPNFSAGIEFKIPLYLFGFGDGFSSAAFGGYGGTMLTLNARYVF